MIVLSSCPYATACCLATAAEAVSLLCCNGRPFCNERRKLSGTANEPHEAAAAPGTGGLQPPSTGAGRRSAAGSGQGACRCRRWPCELTRPSSSCVASLPASSSTLSCATRPISKKEEAQQNPRSDGSPASLARSPRAPVMGSNYTSLPDGLPSPDGGPQSFAPPLPAASQQRRGLWDR